MDIEEVRKAKAEVEAKINDLLEEFILDTDMGITKIELVRQFRSGNRHAVVVGVRIEVKL